MRNWEKILIRVNWLDIHNYVFKKLLEAGTVVELSDSEREDWAGAVHYVPMQLEENPGRESMRYRLCINSRCPDPETKESLHSVLAKGPNCLADQIMILLWARSYPVMLVGDISKAWNVMRTTKVEKNLQRMVW